MAANPFEEGEANHGFLPFKTTQSCLRAYISSSEQCPQREMLA